MTLNDRDIIIIAAVFLYILCQCLLVPGLLAVVKHLYNLTEVNHYAYCVYCRTGR
jgi:hypothetical protein